MSSYHIRQATNADASIIQSIVFDVLAEYGLASDPGGTDTDLNDLDAHYADRGGLFEVLLAPEGDIVGCYGLYRCDGTRCELRKMYLREAHRGQGLGKRLLERSLAQARQLGFQEVELETAGVLREAMALYERYGFQSHQGEHLSTRCDRAYLLKFDVTSEG